MDTAPLVITQFLSYKEVIQNRSKLTVEEYHRDLNMFFEYLLKSRGYEEATCPPLTGN